MVGDVDVAGEQDRTPDLDVCRGREHAVAGDPGPVADLKAPGPPFVLVGGQPAVRAMNTPSPIEMPLSPFSRSGYGSVRWERTIGTTRAAVP